MVRLMHRPAALIGALALSTALFAGLWLSSVSAASFSGVKHGRFDAIDGGGSGCAPAGTVFRDIPGASKTFTLGGTVNRPVLVHVGLQIKVSGQANVIGKVSMLVDGGQQGVGPLTWALRSAVSHYETPAGYTFLTRSLAPGSHTVKLQWQTGSSLTNTFCIDHWTIAIIHV